MSVLNAFASHMQAVDSSLLSPPSTTNRNDKFTLREPMSGKSPMEDYDSMISADVSMASIAADTEDIFDCSPMDVDSGGDFGSSMLAPRHLSLPAFPIPTENPPPYSLFEPSYRSPVLQIPTTLPTPCQPNEPIFYALHMNPRTTLSDIQNRFSLLTARVANTVHPLRTTGEPEPGTSPARLGCASEGTARLRSGRQGVNISIAERVTISVAYSEMNVTPSAAQAMVTSTTFTREDSSFCSSHSSSISSKLHKSESIRIRHSKSINRIRHPAFDQEANKSKPSKLNVDADRRPGVRITTKCVVDLLKYPKRLDRLRDERLPVLPVSKRPTKEFASEATPALPMFHDDGEKGNFCEQPTAGDGSAWRSPLRPDFDVQAAFTPITGWQLYITHLARVRPDLYAEMVAKSNAKAAECKERALLKMFGLLHM